MSARIEELKGQIQTLVAEMRSLERQQADTESKEFIRINRITKDDVETSNAKGEWFGTVFRFADWLKTHSTKRFAEWNGIIYYQSDLKAGVMPATPGRMEDVP